MTLHILYKYIKNTVMIQHASEGVVFSQKGDSNKKNMNTTTGIFVKTKIATTVERQGNQHYIVWTVTRIILIVIRVTKS